MKSLSLLSLLLLVSLAPRSLDAAIVNFQLQGKGGSGLLGANENQANPVNGGSGGMIGSGIFLDDVTRILSINVGWGAGNGFTNLTGVVNAMHIHLSAPDPSFLANGPVHIGLDGLAGFNPSSTAGGLNATVNLTVEDVGSLLAGRFYLNAHTTQFPGGEIRGNITAVPEPTALGLSGLAMFGVGMIRRSRKPSVLA